MIESRAFNKLTVDRKWGTVRKMATTEEGIAKLRREIAYLKILPRQLQVFFPRVIDSGNEASATYLETEFYGYTTLSEAFVQNKGKSVVRWANVFDRIRDVFALFEEFGLSWANNPRTSLQSMLIGKTKSRLNDRSTMSMMVAACIDLDEVDINSKPHRSIARMWPDIEKMASAIEPTELASVIHGDMVFSNILYDFENRIVKLVDPRGSFGGLFGVMGDPRYDIAKLYQCVVGGYDYIIHDLFFARYVGRGEAHIDINSGSADRAIADVFRGTFFTRYKASEITLITALLFASMIPLHYDSAARQTAMYLRALQLLEGLFS